MKRITNIFSFLAFSAVLLALPLAASAQWNGGGYPDGLESDQIPLAARILRVADSYAALTSTRPYRRAKSNLEAKQYLTEWAGIEFDPAVVKAFLAVVPQEEHAASASAFDVRFSMS